MPHYCPISSTVPHTFTTPTHLTRPPPTSTPSITTAGQTQHSHLRWMNNTLATNTHANRSLSHEPKTRSPPPPLPAQQAAQAIHSSPPAFCPPPSPPTTQPRPRTPTAKRTQSLVPNSRARLCWSCRWSRLWPSNARKRYIAFPLRALQVAFWNVFSLRTLK